jgi:copper homeostasis protein
MEACVDCVQSALNAVRGGAKRLELCSGLSEGGLTPSIGLLKTIKSQIVVPVFCMVRPRDGDFLYCDLEVKVMEEDIKMLLSGGADGLVFGCLTKDGKVDTVLCSRLVNTARKYSSGVELTFHRAIDLTEDIASAAETIKQLGFSRVLTSGGMKTAELGKDIIRDLICKYDKSEMIVIPGGGLNESNLEDVLKHTNAFEFHASAREELHSQMEFRNANCAMGSNSSEYSRQISTIDRVSNLTLIFKNVKLSTF